jgi:UDP:flavonoid glycosyltransferase YjiC (YdhE family)
VLNEKPFPFFGPTKQFNQHKTSIIYAYSSILLPKPKDWGSNTHVTGYWFLNSDTDWIAPKELSDFIDNGEKPICFGFGSMTQEDPDYFLEMIIESLRITKQRGILLGGWSGMGYEKKLPDNIMSLHSVPHDWLFPKVAAVVHHGGAGTSAAALRAGVPSIIIPHLGDQPFWASRLFEARYATKPLLKKDLSITELVDRIQDVVNNSKMSEQAKNMQKSICSENGIENAIHIIKKILSSDN